VDDKDEAGWLKVVDGDCGLAKLKRAGNVSKLVRGMDGWTL